MFSKLSLEPKNDINLQKRIQYSTIKAKTKTCISENKFRESTCFGFIIMNDSEIETCKLYLVIPLHGMTEENIDSVNINQLTNLKKIYKYKVSSFHKNYNIDLAVMQIKKNLSLYKELNQDNLIKISDLNLSITKEPFKINLSFDYVSYSTVATANNIDIKSREFKNEKLSKLVHGPSVLLKSCLLDSKKKSKLYLDCCRGLSGLLAFGKEYEYIDSMFTATRNEKFYFLPMIYVKYFINKISNKNNKGMDFLPINAGLTENHNLFALDDFSSIKKNDIIVAIDNKSIDLGHVYVKELNTKIPIDTYIMLYCNNDCNLTILRNLKELDLKVSCTKVK